MKPIHDKGRSLWLERTLDAIFVAALIAVVWALVYVGLWGFFTLGRAFLKWAGLDYGG